MADRQSLVKKRQNARPPSCSFISLVSAMLQSRHAPPWPGRRASHSHCVPHPPLGSSPTQPSQLIRELEHHRRVLETFATTCVPLVATLRSPRGILYYCPLLLSSTCPLAHLRYSRRAAVLLSGLSPPPAGNDSRHRLLVRSAVLGLSQGEQQAPAVARGLGRASALLLASESSLKKCIGSGGSIRYPSAKIIFCRVFVG